MLPHHHSHFPPITLKVFLAGAVIALLVALGVLQSISRYLGLGFFGLIVIGSSRLIDRNR